MNMTTPAPAQVNPLSKEKHVIIVALLTAAGSFLTSLVTQGAVPTTTGAAIGAIIAEALIYEHSA